MSHGSQQLRMFRIAIRDGQSVEDAAAYAGIGIVEARMHYADDLKNPPPPEAFVLLGHNSKEEKPMSENIAADHLRLLIERIERLREEKKGLNDDEKDVFLEAKATGYDVKVMRKILAARARDPNDRATEEAVFATYAAALGMQLGFDI